MRRASAALASLIVAGISAAGGPAEPPAPPVGFVQRNVEAALSSALRGQVRFGTFEVDWLRLEARFRDARLEVVHPSGSRAEGSVRSGRMKIAWTSLPGMAAGTVRISELEVDHPVLRSSTAFLRDWKPGEKRGDGAQIRLDRLMVSGGMLHWEDEESGTGVEAESVVVRGAWSSSRRALVGEFRGQARVTKRPAAAPIAVEARGGFLIRKENLELPAVTLTAEGITTEGQAAATFGPEGAAWSASASFRADVAKVRDWFPRDGVAVAGTAEGSARFRRIPGEPTEFWGSVRLDEARVASVVVPEVEADFRVARDRVEFRAVRGRWFGGKVTGEADLVLGTLRSLRGRFAVRGADGRLLTRAFGREVPVGAEVDAQGSLTIPFGPLSAWQGEMRFLASGVTASDLVPVAGEGTVALREGRLEGRGIRLRGAALRGTVDVDLPLSRGSRPGRVDFRGLTDDLGRSATAGRRLAAAAVPDLPWFLKEEMGGHGAVEGGLTFDPGEPVLHWEIGLDLEDASWAGEPFDRVIARAVRDGEILVLPRVELRRGVQGLQGSARFSVSPFRLDRLEAEVAGVRTAPLLARWDAWAGVEGTLSAALRVERGEAGLGGGGEIRLEAGSLWDESFDLARGRIEVTGDRWILSDGEVEGPAASLGLGGAYDTATGMADGTVRIRQARLEGIHRLAGGPVALRGSCTGEGTWGWRRGAGAEARVSLDVRGLAVGSADTWVPLGDAVGTWSLAGGELSLALSEAARSAWRLDGSVRTEEGLPFGARLDMDRYALTLPGTDDAVSLELSGSSSAHGMLTRVETLALEGEIDRLKLYVPGGSFETLQAVPFSLSDRRLRAGPAQLGTEGARLEAHAEWDTADGEVAGEFRGVADLALVSLLRRNLRGSGRLDVDVRLSGSLSAPELVGRATVSNGRIRWVGLRQTLDEVDARVTFDGRSVRLEQFRAVSGGGELDGDGSFVMGPDGIPRFDVTVGVSTVAVVFPEGFRGIYDGALRLQGTTTSSVLGGRLSLIRGLWDRDFEVAGLGGASAREVERDVLADLPREVALDVEIEGIDDIWMRNNFGRLEASASLRVQGDLRDPRLSGRIFLFEGGRLRFRDVDYRLLSGSLEFEGGEAIDPFLEVRGETRVREYDIRLRIAGKLDAFEYELSSHPMLPESDIIYLLLTGQVPSSATTPGGTGASTTTGGLAADYFTGVLTGGIARQVQKAFRLDQFRINPLLESGADPTARVTLGKQVTDRMRVLYSVDVGGAEEDRYFVEWEASRRWRLTAEADSAGVYVGTAQFTDRYGREGSGTGAESGDDRSRETFAVEEIEFRGAEPGEADDLLRGADLAAGDRLRRPDVFAAADTMRRSLVKQGWVDARVATEIRRRTEVSPDPTEVPVALEFEVTRGTRTEIVLEGLSGRLERATRKSVEEFLLEGFVRSDFAEEVSEVVREELQVRGRYAADVASVLEVDGEGGRILRVLVDPGPVVRASAVRVEGTSQIPEDRVRKQILTGRSEGLSTRPIRPAVLEEDAGAIMALYRREGFLDAEVETPRVRLGVTGDAGEVLFVVHEGDRYAIDRIDVEIQGALDRQEVEAWADLQPGQPASAAALAAAARRVRAGLDALGFATARADVGFLREDDGILVRLRVITGPRMRYAGTVVSGNFRTEDRVVIREAPFRPGEPITEAGIRAFQHRLYRLGVFRSAEVSPEPAPDGDPDAYRLLVRVEEAKPVGLNVGFGYDSDAGPRLGFGVGHDNLGGHNRSLSLQTRWSSLERRFQLVARDPWLFQRRLNTTATYFWEDVEEPGFEIRRNSLAFRVERHLTSRWTRFLRYNYQKVDIEIIDPSDDVLAAIREQKLQDLRLGDAGVAFTRDTRDDSFLPTRGGYALAEVRLFAPVFLSDESFVKGYLQGSTTHTFPRGVAYSAALRLGAAQTFGSTQSVPLSERFFAGGSSTLRGFERDTVGLVVDGVPIGGEAMLILNQEFRWPLWKTLALVTFTDWGNVYSDLRNFDPSDLRYTAGLGIRLDTPIGPLRFEYGRKLDRRETESRGEIYFAVGTIY